MNTDFVLRECRRFGAVAASALMIAALGMAPAYAVNDEGFFELDANTADQSSPVGDLPDDWDSMPGSGGAGAGTLHTTKSTGIVTDTDPAVFRNGSKDIQDISAWRFDLGSSPPKDDIQHAYAAAYTAATTANGSAIGDLLVYFGADRASFNGTASLGFWFFKNPVARDNATGRFVVPGTSTPAQHANGDTLVAFEYTNGGAVTGVRIFKWVGTGTSGSLFDLGTIGLSATNVGGLFCNGLTDTICGATNPGNLTLPWNGTIQPGQFFEGGINISQVIGGDNCFASFMATSRSSDQSNASIKNFILSQFPVCHLSVTKRCPSAVFQQATNNVLNTIQGKILNDGGGLLSAITLVDNPALDAGTLGYFACVGTTDTPDKAQPLPLSSTLASGASLCYEGKFTSNTLTTSDTVTVTASTGGGTVTGTASAECNAPAPPVGLVVTKTCDVDLVAANSELSVKINYSGTVQNTGEVALTGVKVCEAHEVTIPAGSTPCDVTHTTHTIGTLAAGASANYSGFYVPTEALTGALESALLLPHTAVFRDQAGAEGTKPAILGGGTVKAIPVEKTCPMCP